MATNRVSPKGRKISDVPKTPVIGTATAGSGSASVTFTAAVGGLGGRTSSYSVRSTPGNFIGLGTSSPITVSGIVGYGSYTFSVAGINPSGTGTYSEESNAVTIQTVPGAPTIGTATAVSSSDVSVTFTPPANDGGLTITSYVVLSSSGESTSGSSSPITFTEVMPGTYTYQVRAVNSIGTSTYSAASNSATVNPSLARISYLVVAGGGGGTASGYEATGAAGAGGVRGGNTGPGTVYFTQTPGTTYTITVGAGAAGSGNAQTSNGSPSSISGSGLTTISASGGAGNNITNGGINGRSGGCGSGASGNDGTSTTWTGGAGNSGGYTPEEGYSGGNTQNWFISQNGYNRTTGGGGGGAGGQGGTGYVYYDGGAFTVRKRGAYGGSGKYYAEDGYAYYGGGGGSQSSNLNFSFNNGGTGGGGNGVNAYDNPSRNGVANKGGGGGSGSGTSYPGGNGGSGIVILAYPNIFPDAVSYSGATYTDNGTYKLYKFTGSGSIRFV